MPRNVKLTRIARALGAQLRRRRNELDITQEHLAHEAGISVSFLSRCECGQSQPSVGVLVHIARGLKTQSSAIMAELETELARQQAL